MARKKNREEVSPEVAAQVLFLSDRTCCVCCDRSKRVQIHHIDGDPANNTVDNLAALCAPCHDETLLTGGFTRKLDADQIRLFRKDWYSCLGRHLDASGDVPQICLEVTFCGTDSVEWNGGERGASCPIQAEPLPPC